MIDTHSHIYSEEFDEDRDEVIARAKEAGVTGIILPNVDETSIERLHHTGEKYQNYCYAAMGLHPTSVNGNYMQSLQIIEEQLAQRHYVAIGEIGIDLYWDKTFLKEQIKAFEQQLEWALKYDYPVIIHMRDSYREIIESVKKYSSKGLKGIFHSFSGTVEQAREILDTGTFKLGINGVVTFKNSGMDKVVSQLNLSDLVIETDAPYLTPVPYRGKRNESSYVALVANKLAEIFNTGLPEIDETTTASALSIFNLNS